MSDTAAEPKHKPWCELSPCRCMPNEHGMTVEPRNRRDDNDRPVLVWVVMQHGMEMLVTTDRQRANEVADELAARHRSAS